MDRLSHHSRLLFAFVVLILVAGAGTTQARLGDVPVGTAAKKKKAEEVQEEPGAREDPQTHHLPLGAQGAAAAARRRSPLPVREGGAQGDHEGHAGRRRRKARSIRKALRKVSRRAVAGMPRAAKRGLAMLDALAAGAARRGQSNSGGSARRGV